MLPQMSSSHLLPVTPAKAEAHPTLGKKTSAGPRSVEEQRVKSAWMGPRLRGDDGVFGFGTERDRSVRVHEFCEVQ